MVSRVFVETSHLTKALIVVILFYTTHVRERLTTLTQLDLTDISEIEEIELHSADLVFLVWIHGGAARPT